MAPVRAVVFDLDGTLADSLADITASTNACLAEAGLPTHDDDAVRGFVGHGIGALVERALGPHATPDRVASLLAAIRTHYRDHCTVRTRPFPGIPALLESLSQRGIAMGVVSNKPHDMTVKIVETLMPTVRFGFVTGERPEVPRKPDPTGILTACSTLDVPPPTTLYVGDTPVDMEASRAAGVTSVAVTWGFRPRVALEAAEPDHVVGHPEEILSILRTG
jgi:phosphoglycolate phosphatase